MERHRFQRSSISSYKNCSFECLILLTENQITCRYVQRFALTYRGPKSLQTGKFANAKNRNFPALRVSFGKLPKKIRCHSGNGYCADSHRLLTLNRTNADTRHKIEGKGSGNGIKGFPRYSSPELFCSSFCVLCWS